MRCHEVREYLFAFLDNELDARLSIELQCHLEQCGSCAREVEIERAVHRSLSANLNHPISDEAAVDESLRRASSVIGIKKARPRYSGLRRRAMAAISMAAVIVIGSMAWLWSRSSPERPTAEHFADLVVADFQHFVSEGLRVQFSSDKSKAVSAWLRARTGLAMVMPVINDRNCRLVGARKCSLAGRPAAFALYRIGGVPASLVVTSGKGVDVEQMARVNHHDFSHWLDRCQGHTVLVCRRGALLYAAVSTLPEEDLLCLMTGEKHEGH